MVREVTETSYKDKKLRRNAGAFLVRWISKKENGWPVRPPVSSEFKAPGTTANL